MAIVCVYLCCLDQCTPYYGYVVAKPFHDRDSDHHVWKLLVYSQFEKKSIRLVWSINSNQRVCVCLVIQLHYLNFAPLLGIHRWEISVDTANVQIRRLCEYNRFCKNYIVSICYLRLGTHVAVSKNRVIEYIFINILN